MAKLFGTFTGHIPPEIQESNLNVRKLADVLDGMQQLKEAQVEKYADSFNPRTAHNIETLRYYVDEWGGEYLPDTPHRALECLYLHKDFIFSMLGTQAGLRQWLECITGGGIISDLVYTPPYPYIHFHTLGDGVLPNGQDIANEMAPPEGRNPYLIPTLLADSWAQGYSKLTVTITGAYDTSDNFKNWLIDILPRYLPNGDKYTTIITLNLL
jgi:hypothetical protein